MPIHSNFQPGMQRMTEFLERKIGNRGLQLHFKHKINIPSIRWSKNLIVSVYHKNISWKIENGNKRKQKWQPFAFKSLKKKFIPDTKDDVNIFLDKTSRIKATKQATMFYSMIEGLLS